MLQWCTYVGIYRYINERTSMDKMYNAFSIIKQTKFGKNLSKCTSYEILLLSILLSLLYDLITMYIKTVKYLTIIYRLFSVALTTRLIHAMYSNFIHLHVS